MLLLRKIDNSYSFTDGIFQSIISAAKIPVNVGNQTITLIYHPSVPFLNGCFRVNAAQFHRNHNIIIVGFIVYFVCIQAVCHIREYKYKTNDFTWVSMLCGANSGRTLAVKFTHAASIKSDALVRLNEAL